MTLRERFEALVDRTSDPDGCWPWLGAKMRRGYGKVGSGGKRGSTLGANRVALSMALGRPIRPGLCALHSCDNPECCRVGPGHLYEGTRAQNNADMVARGRSVAGRTRPRVSREANGNARLTEEAVAEILTNHAACALSLAHRFGVSRQTIYRVRRGVTWSTPHAGFDVALVAEPRSEHATPLGHSR